MNATLFLILGLLIAGQTPTGTDSEISGTVVQANSGEPLQGISVHVLRKRYDEFGIQRMTSLGSVITNDRGEYRFSNIHLAAAPGAAMPPAWIVYIAATGPGSTLTFYPGALDVSGAVSISLLPGQQLRGIDLEIPKTPVFKIRGRMFDALHVRQPHLSSVTLVRRDVGLPSSSAYTVAEDGAFEISDVPPGSYYLVGMRIDDEPNRSRTVVQVVVEDEDIENLELVAAEGHEIEGHVRVEGPPINHLNVALKPVVDPGSLLDVPPAVRPDGTFIIAGLPSGEYRLSVTGMPDEFYVKSARFGPIDALEHEISLHGAVTGSLDVVLSNDGGRIAGRVADAGAKSVILAPETPRPERSDLYKRAPVDANGRFSISGIAPGTYQIFAVQNIDPETYRDPNFLEQFKNRSYRVRIIADELISLELK
jgi:protocatechuate 3,4-dioxygenase beta subunit